MHIFSIVCQFLISLLMVAGTARDIYVQLHCFRHAPKFFSELILARRPLVVIGGLATTFLCLAVAHWFGLTVLTPTIAAFMVIQVCYELYLIYTAKLIRRFCNAVQTFDLGETA